MRELIVDPQMIEQPWALSITGLEEADPVMVERVKDAIDALPDDQREVVECLFYGRYTKVEIAEMTGRTRQSIHDLWKRAQDTLRAELQDLL